MGSGSGGVQVSLSFSRPFSAEPMPAATSGAYLKFCSLAICSNYLRGCSRALSPMWQTRQSLARLPVTAKPGPWRFEHAAAGEVAAEGVGELPVVEAEVGGTPGAGPVAVGEGELGAGVGLGGRDVAEDALVGEDPRFAGAAGRDGGSPC